MDNNTGSRNVTVKFIGAGGILDRWREKAEQEIPKKWGLDEERDRKRRENNEFLITSKKTCEDGNAGCDLIRGKFGTTNEPL